MDAIKCRLIEEYLKLRLMLIFRLLIVAVPAVDPLDTEWQARLIGQQIEMRHFYWSCSIEIIKMEIARVKAEMEKPHIKYAIAAVFT